MMGKRRHNFLDLPLNDFNHQYAVWILSFLHYIIHKDHSEVDTTGAGVMETVFRIADGLNMLRGFFMFIILVCKKDILNKLKRKFMTDSEIPFKTFTLRSPRVARNEV